MKKLSCISFFCTDNSAQNTENPKMEIEKIETEKIENMNENIPKNSEKRENSKKIADIEKDFLIRE